MADDCCIACPFGAYEALEACRMIVKKFDGLKRTALSPDLLAVIDTAKRAIAKSEASK